MEDPPDDVQVVVRGLVQTPTLMGQAETLQKYFTEDVNFYHFLINTNGGRKDLIAIYQMAEVFLNYRRVEFEKIIYGEKENAMALQMVISVRPFTLFFTLFAVHFFTKLEFEDFVIEGRKTVRKIESAK